MEYSKSTFNSVHLDRNPITCSCVGIKKGLNEIRFGTFVGRFANDGAANMAVNRLRVKPSGSAGLCVLTSPRRLRTRSDV